MNLLDIGILRSQRMSVLYKHSDIVNIKYERNEFRRVAIAARQHIHHARKVFPNVHPKSWVYDSDTFSVFSHPLANHWCDNLSTPYSDYMVGE